MVNQEFDIRNLRIEDFSYSLPEERIAKYPLKQRDECKLLLYRPDGSVDDLTFRQIVDEIPSDAAVIYNDSKVINARIKFRKGELEDGAPIEVFCLDPFSPADYERIFACTSTCQWQCFVGNSKRWKEGTALRRTLTINGGKVVLTAERIDRKDYTSVVKFSWDERAGVTFSQIISAVGELPIPPYLNRATEESDNDDYQTVYSAHEGSVAAPTAGLHFTHRILDEMKEKGVALRHVVLHVGAGTFQPVTSATIGEHSMHFEYISVERSLIEEILQWKNEEKKIFAVGTTSVRTLESLYYIGCLMHEGRWEGEVPQWYAYSGECPRLSLGESLQSILDNMEGDRCVAETQLLIAPGFRFRIIDGMVTNFHQPSSTLLLLVSAFMGRHNADWESWKRVYRHAMDHGYRFLSYGDACLLL